MAEPQRIKITSRPQWMELRAKYGGSSEAPALFDQGGADLPSRWSLYALKTGQVRMDEPGPDDRRWWGTKMEEICAAAVAEEQRWDLKMVDQYVIHPRPELRMGSTVDRYVVGHSWGPGLLECKNRDYFAWKENYTEEDASMSDRIQLSHHFACDDNIRWGCVGVVVGGNQLKTYIYSRSDLAREIEAVEQGWSEFWPLVERREEPPLVAQDVPDWLRAHQADEPLKMLELPPDEAGEFELMCETYSTLDKRAKAAAEARDEAKAWLLQRLGAHEGILSLGYWFTCKKTPVKPSMVTLPDDIRAGLLDMKRDIEADPEQDDHKKEILRLLNDAIDWQQQVRAASIRASLKIEPTRGATKEGDGEIAAAEKAAKRRKKKVEATDGNG